MIFGFAITLPVLAIGGVTMLALLFFQMASGLRWIKLPPKHRLKIHKTVGLTLVAFAVLHGSMGLILATGLTVG